MPPAGRLGDQAQCPSDGHGCPGCAHGVIGPATAGSPDVMINGQPALRIGDPGVHSACCGPNTWNAAAGSATVFINGIKAHRLSDKTVHCGGSGELVEGSADVIIGDSGGGASSQIKAPSYDDAFILLNRAGKPVADRSYRITLGSGRIVEGKTDAEGRTQLVSSKAAETLKLDILEADFEDVDDW